MANLIILVLGYAIGSQNGMFRAEISYRNGPVLMTSAFALYNKKDEIIYQKTEIEATTFFISNQGTVFALDEARVSFYDPAGGEKILKVLHYPNGAGFSSDQTVFFISDQTGISAYSLDGDLVHFLKPGRLFEGQGRGRIVATISNDTLSIYDDGVERFVYRLSTPYARSLRFSDDKIIVEEPVRDEVFDLGIER
jgi:hypothetical protein